MSIAFKPLFDKVLIERVEAEEKTASGLIIPDTAKEKPVQGKVIAVGNGARNECGQVVPMTVKPGDIVLFGKWAGNEVKIENKDYLVIKESDIIGIFE
ncbi:MAG: co-chaperone GroES [Alphaproteobacteria bacterium]|nr:co-chaperone GroES [Alphaproteobacteria bacterium]